MIFITLGEGYPDVPSNFYLTAHEYGEGRVVVDEIGHSMGFDGFITPSKNDCRIFVNALHWAAQTVPPEIGDLDGDGTLSPVDAAIALRLAVTGAHDDAADVSGDGCVTSLDALMILQAAAGAISL